MAKTYLLMDANVTTGYYLPRSLRSVRARARVESIINAARSGSADLFLCIPNFCIAEVFSTFMKCAFGGWNRHVRSAGGRIDRRVYQRLVSQFQKDIHNGAVINQSELSRYHVLGINLVAPIDHHFQIRRAGRNHRPMSTLDHLLVSMGIQLAKVHGQDRVVVISTDRRLCDVLKKCRVGLRSQVIHRLKLRIAREVTGREYSPDLYPTVIDLANATKAELEAALPRGATSLSLGSSLIRGHSRMPRSPIKMLWYLATWPQFASPSKAPRPARCRLRTAQCLRATAR